MKKIDARKFQTFALTLVPFFILFAIDETFNVQSILIPIIILCSRALSFKNGFKIKKNLLLGVLLFCCTIVISLVINIVFYSDQVTNLYMIRILYTFVIILFYYLGIQVEIEYSQLRLILIISIIPSLIISIYFIFVNSIWYTNFLGTMIDKNFSGANIALEGEIVLYLIISSSKKIAKFFYSLEYILLIVGAFYSGSRAAMLVIIGGSLLILIEALAKDKKNKGLKFLITVCCIVLFIVVILPVIINKISSNTSLQWYWNRYFVNSYSDYSNNTRITYWLNGLKLWLERPVFGHGPGLVSVTLAGSAVSHNTFIDFMVDEGVIGIICIITIYYISMRELFRFKSGLAIPLSIILYSFILSMTRSSILWFSLILMYQYGEILRRDDNKSL